MNELSDLKKIILEDKKKCVILKACNFDNIDTFLDEVAYSLSLGNNLIIIDGDTIKPKELLECSYKIRQLCSLYNALFILKNRIDIAKITYADGVYLDNDDIDIKSAREILEKDKLIGIHSNKTGDINNSDFVIADKYFGCRVPVYIIGKTAFYGLEHHKKEI